jgi:TrmH family RNA methyltransferase
VTTPPSLLRFRPVAASHPDARRYLLARRNVLPRHESVIAIAGLWAHQQALRLGAAIEVFLWCPSAGGSDRSVTGVVDDLSKTAEASYEISERTLARLQPDAHAPGLLSILRIPSWTSADVLRDAGRLVLVADGIEYAGNLGALLRTVDASGAHALIVTNPVARRTHPAIFSASRGTVLTTPTLEFASVAEARCALESAGFEIIVADPDGAVDFRTVGYDGRRTAIVVGAEGAGVCDDWRSAATQRVSISMRGNADSLNVATAAAVLLFNASR